MRGRRIPIPLPNTGALARKRNSYYIRTILIICLVLFAFLQLHIINYNFREPTTTESTNDSAAAILSLVPPVYHKYLTAKNRNHTGVNNGTAQNGQQDQIQQAAIERMQQNIARYNELQSVLNEDIFGPLQNDSVIIVVQVHTRITYLRHLIVSLAQARDISKTLLIFSHDYYDEDINDLVQSIDFCKVMQIFYPYSIQTHEHEFPGADPGDCPRDIKRDQAIIRKCNNALHPDSYGHYREAKFTQTKHHWWWKANRVFDQLDVTRHHTGLVLFLEEDHYVAEDFLYLLALMQKRAAELCTKCNILSLGTYLKTFNYYTYSNNNKNNAFYGQSHTSSASNTSKFGTNINKVNNHNHMYHNIYSNNNIWPYKSVNQHNYNKDLTYKQSTNVNNIIRLHQHSSNRKPHAITYNAHHQLIPSVDKIIKEKHGTETWGYQVLPSLYAVYQKVEVTPWISSKHNMGFAFNRNTWRNIVRCANHFCSYDDYNWDWSLQHVSQQCLKNKLHAMVVKGPRVFHIGECGVHHKKKNCESNQVISKVQQVLRIANKSNQMFPKSLTLTVASVLKKTKLRKGNGGWGDNRDINLCLNFTYP